MNSANTLEELMFESNFTILPGQTTVYSVTHIKSKFEGVKHLLVALMNGRILHCMYQKEGSVVRRHDREIPFRLIGQDCNIVSIDSCTCKKRGVVIGITYYKETNGQPLRCFNLYWYRNPMEQHNILDLNSISQSCQKIDIGFMPYQLTHCRIVAPDSTEMIKVFVLLGGDKKAHQYRYSPHNGSYVESKNESYFVEFPDAFEQIPINVNFKTTLDEKRITAVGFHAGDVKVFVTDIKSNSVLHTYTTQHDSPIVNVHLFTTIPSVSKYRPAMCQQKEELAVAPSKHSDSVHLLVISAWENAVVYSSIVKNHFNSQVVLERSSESDVPTCCTIADVDQNGENDIMIGTFGQELIVYKFTVESKDSIPPSWNRSFSYPVINIRYLDMIADGLEELVVVTAKGLHVFQYNMDDTVARLKRRMMEFYKNENEEIRE